MDKIYISTFWDGYCPECSLKGKRVRMKLNYGDLFECEESRLQIVLTATGVLATILKFRGKGEFRTTPEYADELPREEILCPQTLDNFPYNDSKIFKSSEEIEKYINESVK